MWAETEIWRAYAISTVLAIGLSHANLMIGAKRPSDGHVIKFSTDAAIACGAIDTSLIVLALASAIDLSADLLRLLAVLVILQVLASLLPPILRRAPKTIRPDTGESAGRLVL